MSNEIRVSGLFDHPIKSCAKRELSHMEIPLSYDRRWMVVDKDGNFVTQRNFPKMALIKPEITDGTLIISAPGEQTVLKIPLDYPGQKVRVVVWGNQLEGVNDGEIPNQWFSDYLGIACSLVHMAPNYVREKWAGYGRFQYADSYPLHITNEGSLQDLNGRIIKSGDTPVLMDGFRPNIIVCGEPYIEDTWALIRIGKLLVYIVKPCVRCPIPQINQETGVKGKQPNKELYRYRRVSPKEVIFGQKAVSRDAGIIYLGDSVEILEEKEAQKTI